MTQEQIDRLSFLWPKFIESRANNTPFIEQQEFNEFVSLCCRNGHKYPDGSSSIHGGLCCLICGWDTVT